MRRLTLILACAAVAWSSTGMAAGAASETIHTSKTRFRIPFRYDHTEMQRLGAREVQLFFSTDRGRTWQLAQRVVPMAGRFEFRAPAEGEYWFSVRTLDARNELHPAGETIEPGLKVIVDTTPPRMELKLQQVAPGRVELSWSCDDAHLDASQLRLEYIQAGDARWNAVQVVPQPTGRTAWSVPRGGQVAVRGSVRDLASNEAQAQSQIEIAPAGAAAPAGTRDRRSDPPPRVPDLNEPIADDSEPAPGPPRISPSSRLVSDDGSNRPPILRGPDPVPAVPAAPAAAAPFAIDERDQLPSRRIVNSVGFQIEYTVEGVGPSGVGSVELFITENGGQKWYKYGEDADRESPFEVRVPRDGIYGFTIRVRSGVGLADPPPQAGEPPSLVVVVDTTPPTVEMLPVRPVRGGETNRLEIGWRLTDANPAEKPVALSYAADRQGQWQPITDWQPDTGRYVWTTDSSVPPKVFVRLTARDAAGNQQSVETAEPVVVDTSRPTARLINVQSAPRGSR